MLPAIGWDVHSDHFLELQGNSAKLPVQQMFQEEKVGLRLIPVVACQLLIYQQQQPGGSQPMKSNKSDSSSERLQLPLVVNVSS